MQLEIFQVDAFTDRPFAGNPAAVCPVDEFPAAQQMQQIAAEMNLSETAFVVPDGTQFQLRWFTPTVEVDLCGHATLATAHVLWESKRVAYESPAVFQTLSGTLTTRHLADSIEMDFPAIGVQPADPPPDLVEALGVKPLFVGLSKFDYLVQAATEQEVVEASVDHARLRSLGVRGVILTARGNGDPYDFVSRFFAPGSGIDEDPVTGSAHCVLGPFWAGQLGKNDFRAYQASRRGGALEVMHSGERVRLRGRAVTVLRGVLTI